MPYRRKHGGSRAGSGRKAKSLTLGPVQTRNSLENFGFSSQQSRQRDSTTPSASQEIIPHETRNTTREITTETQTTAIVPARVTRSTQSSANDAPNFNADDIFDESVFDKGKKIHDSENLKIQRQAINSSKYYKNWSRKIEETGVLWDNPPSLIKKPKFGIKKRWLDFFQMRVFNFFPEAMIGKNWSPYCPNCKQKLSRNGHFLEPRLVFDQYDNYWLNAPNKYICRECEISDAPNKKAYNFRTTSNEIMNQIRDCHPEIYNLFPCYITSKNAIDKKLMDSIIHNTVKGIGPSAMRETIVSLHELEWQKKENSWAMHIINDLSNPFRSEPVSQNEIEKCPEYFSSQLGGCVPSGKWLVEVFCTVLSKKRAYFDSECLKRAQSTKILAIDASYKVPKWMMKWGSHKIYDALHSGTNEYNEVVMQRFSTSDNHSELGTNLKSLSSLGLNPHLAFSDDPIRDETLLKQYFPLLKNMTDQDEIPEDMVEMTTHKQILYLHKLQDALDALSRFRYRNSYQ